MTASGAKIDRYELVQLLGEGGMGQVHLARAQGAAGFEKLVALKLLAPQHTGDAGRMRSLLREAMIGVRLDHENIVQVLDFGEHEGRYFVAMEYVRGYGLSHVTDHVRRGGDRMPIQVAAHVARTLAGALHFVHRLADTRGEPLGLLHGDVSPANVLLGVDGRIKLSDFGVSALARELRDSTLVAGKLPYLPPEAYRGARRAQAWDVYALGAILYEAIAGRPAFGGDSVDAIQQALAQPPRPITSIRSDCPVPLIDVVARAIAYDPDERYPTPDALRAALADAYPRRVDDADVHRTYVEHLFGDPEFVSAHGKLPTTGGFQSTLSLQPLLRDARDVQTAVSAPHTPQALRFGLSPAHGPERARSEGEAIAAYLSGRLGRGVNAVVFGDYRTLVDSTAQGQVDLAWMPPVAFAAASDLAVGGLVTAERRGLPSYQSAIVVRAESSIQSLVDLRGRSMAWVDRESASGYLFAAAELIRELGRLDDALGRQHFFGSHREVCEAVANGWSDAGATFVVRDQDGATTGAAWIDFLGPRAAELRPIAFSAPIPGDSIVHRPHLSDRLCADLASAFLGMARCDDGRRLLAGIFHADSFAPTNLAAYETVRSRLRLL